jgi:hypothetical protein
MADDYSIDDKEVGQSGSPIFRPSADKQRFALLPFLYVETDFSVSPEEKVKAEAGDPQARADIARKEKTLASIQEGLKKTPPSVLAFDPDPQVPATGKRFFYPRLRGAPTIFIESAKKTYMVPEDINKQLSDAGKQVYVRYACVVIKYATYFSDGECRVIPPQTPQQVGGKSIPFDFAIQRMPLNGPQMAKWKSHHQANPPISCDYYIWTVQQGSQDRWEFSPAGPALWQTVSPEATFRIVSKAREEFSKLDILIGNKTDSASLLQMVGMATPAASSPQKTAQNFSTMIGD